MAMRRAVAICLLGFMAGAEALAFHPTSANPLPLHAKHQVAKAPMRLRGGGLIKMTISSLANAGGLVTSAAIVGGMNVVGFAITALTGTHLVTDLIGTGSFAISSIASLLIGHGGGTRALVSTVCITTWSIRLASFLFLRILKTKKDARLSEVFSTPFKMMLFWFASAMWGFVCLIPHSMLCFQKEEVAMRGVDWLMTSCFAAGFAIESVADWQKWIHKRSKESAHTLCRSGLWSLSRHPNYFGEILVWTALCALDASGLRSLNEILLSFLSPAFISWLLISVSGVPLAEKKMEKRFGSDEDYRLYKANTPLLVPNILKLLRK